MCLGLLVSLVMALASYMYKWGAETCIVLKIELSLS